MTVTAHLPSRSSGMLRELDGAPVLGFIGPNWFATVMGTGIIAVAATGLPIPFAGATGLAVAAWLLAATLLVVVTGATLGHWILHPRVARGHLDHPVLAHFYGAPPMALMTVGAGTLLAGHHLIGMTAAVRLDWIFWASGTVLGVAVAVIVPVRTFWRRDVAADAAFGGWLMPVVPPMVSAATGALLVQHLPAGREQTLMLLVCWTLFAVALAASIVVIALICRRVVRQGGGAAAAVPTLWIVLGPLGQSVTAACHLAAGGTARDLAASYGLVVLTFALLWMTVAVTFTIRAARAGLPFSLTWWSFTFPVGTVVTGASALSAATGSHLLAVAASALFAALVAAWVVVATRTCIGVCRGSLLQAP